MKTGWNFEASRVKRVMRIGSGLGSDDTLVKKFSLKESVWACIYKL